VAEQRYQAVLAVIGDGLSISQVAEKVGVLRQTLLPDGDFFGRVGGVRSICVGAVSRNLGVLLFRSLRRCVCELSST